MNRPHPLGQRYAFVVAGLIFTTLLTAAAIRSAPGVLMIPWQKAFGWERSTISVAAALGIMLYGLMGPFAAAIMQRFGIRRTMAVALAVMSLSTGASLFMTEPWQLVLTWGVFSGTATGSVAIVLAATIVNRWFVTNRSLAMGVLTASTATGNLVFQPVFAAIAQVGGWKPVCMVIMAATALLIPLILTFLPERPSSIGTEPYGAPVGQPPPPEAKRENPVGAAFSALFRASKKPDFWLLFGTFAVCGFTTNGLVGTHMVSLCADNAIPAVMAGGLMAMMGAFDMVGTTASGWLTDRFDPRKLLFIYYGLRGISLIYLPNSDFSLYGLSVFAMFYGLDWVATVPPTLKLANQAFGEKDAPIVFGWIGAGHQLGGASAALMGGVLRTEFGTYLQAFMIAGGTAVLAAFAALMIGRWGRAPSVSAAT